MRPRLSLALGLLLLLAPGSRADLPRPDSRGAGFDPDRLGRIDAAVERAVAEQGGPRRGGAGRPRRQDRATRRRSAVGRVGRPTRADDARHGLRHGLADQAGRDGDLGDDPGRARASSGSTTGSARYLPEFDNHGKGAITVEQLLRHRAGLIADNPIADYADGPEEAWKRIAELEPRRTRRASGSSTATSAS